MSSVVDLFERVIRRGPFFYVPRATWEAYKTGLVPLVRLGRGFSRTSAEWRSNNAFQMLADWQRDKRGSASPPEPHLVDTTEWEELERRFGIAWEYLHRNCPLQLSSGTMVAVLSCEVWFYGLRREPFDYPPGEVVVPRKIYTPLEARRIRRRLHDYLDKHPGEAIRIARGIEELAVQ